MTTRDHEPGDRHTTVAGRSYTETDFDRVPESTGYWRDRIRWGPIWAGLLTSIALLILLSTIAVAVGAQVAQTGVDTEQAGLGGAIVGAIIALIAFLVGGFIASRGAAVMGRAYGALNGFLVWALGLAVILALAAMGLGAIFGAAGDLFAQYRALGSPTPNADVDPQQAAQAIRNSSIGALIGMVLPAIAATLGGWLGAREPVLAEPR